MSAYWLYRAAATETPHREKVQNPLASPWIAVVRYSLLLGSISRRAGFPSLLLRLKDIWLEAQGKYYRLLSPLIVLLWPIRAERDAAGSAIERVPAVPLLERDLFQVPLIMIRVWHLPLRACGFYWFSEAVRVWYLSVVLTASRKLPRVWYSWVVFADFRR